MKPDDTKLADSHDQARQEWSTRARRYLKRELRQREVTYKELARRLNEMGLHETPGSITTKIARGLYPAWFLLAVLYAIGCQRVRLDDLE